MITHNIDPVFAAIGPLEIRYYGIIFALGFLLVLWIASIIAEKKRVKGIDKRTIIDACIWAIIGIILGTRLLYVLVYNPGYYIRHLIEIPMIWKGGIAFHGGLIGAVIAVWLFARKNKLHFYDIVDILVVPLPLALALGRISNFINGELIGRVTNVPWAFDFGDGIGRHPSQLYESFKNLMILFIMLYANQFKKLKRGFLFWLFVLLYGSFRFITGFFRAPDPQLGFIMFGLTMGQLFSGIMVICAVLWLVRKRSLS